jgi:hypothetical protein
VKFFIPYTKDKKQAEKVLQGIKKFAKETIGWDITDRRIFSLSYTHEGKKYHSEVGKPDDRVDEEVIAILESYTYLVCTPNRGVLRGEPVLVGKEEVKKIIDFEK